MKVGPENAYIFPGIIQDRSPLKGLLMGEEKETPIKNTTQQLLFWDVKDSRIKHRNPMKQQTV